MYRNPAELEKRELIALCLKDDRHAQTQLFNDCYPRILACIRQYFTDIDTCKDILQEVMVKVFSQLYTLRDDAIFDGWCRKIAVNTCLSRIRKDKKNLISTLTEKVTAVPDEGDDRDEYPYRVEDVYEVLDKLPVGYRTVFNLFVVENYSHKEIALELGITESTSKSQFFKAKKMIEKMVKQKYPENEHE